MGEASLVDSESGNFYFWPFEQRHNTVTTPTHIHRTVAGKKITNTKIEPRAWLLSPSQVFLHTQKAASCQTINLYTAGATESYCGWTKAVSHHLRNRSDKQWFPIVSIWCRILSISIPQQQPRKEPLARSPGALSEPGTLGKPPPPPPTFKGKLARPERAKPAQLG